MHLGAMPEAVDAVVGAPPALGTCSCSTTRTPAAHLPDITLVSPVARGDEVLASRDRAHHSDVGGMRPGSMPADSAEI